MMYWVLTFLVYMVCGLGARKVYLIDKKIFETDGNTKTIYFEWTKDYYDGLTVSDQASLTLVISFVFLLAWPITLPLWLMVFTLIRFRTNIVGTIDKILGEKKQNG